MAELDPLTEEQLDEIFEHGVVGIDLGTTYSAVAAISEAGLPEVLANREGSLITPSVVLFDEDGATLVGEVAKSVGQAQRDRVVECAKRFMGNPETRYEIAGSIYTPEGISGIILAKLVRDASDRLGCPVRSAAITVPAWFGHDAKQATLRAGRAAGLHVLGIVSEPTAAALAYGMGERREEVWGRTALVYDLGGGTFDLSIIDIDDWGNIEELAREGDVFLGGKDWDQRIVDRARRAFAQEFHEELPEDSDAYLALNLEAEAAKKRLTEAPSARLLVQHQDKRFTFRMARGEFEGWTADLLLRTEETLRVTLQAAGLTADDVDVCLPVGGSTRMPQVRELLERTFPGCVDDTVKRDQVVALGACLYASRRLLEIQDEWGIEMEDEDGIPVPDLAPAVYEQLTNTRIIWRSSRAYGIMALDEDNRPFNDHFVETNEPLPVDVEKLYTTAMANQRTVVLQLLEGDSEVVEECEKKKEQEFPLPRGLPADAELPVEFYFTDDQGILITLSDPDGNEHVFTYGDPDIEAAEQEAVDRAIDALE